MNRICEVCNNAISLDVVNYNLVKYCNSVCRYKARDIRRGRPLKEERVCLECNSVIDASQRRDKVYCNVDCKAKGVKRNAYNKVKEELKLGKYRDLVTDNQGIAILQVAGKRQDTVLVDSKYLGVVLSISANWYINSKGYARTSGNVMLHRVIYELEHGELPEFNVDHKNRNKLDNRVENLRAATHGQNNANATRKTNSCKYKGVYKNYDKYVAQITINDKVTHLGRFNTPEEAALAYNEAALLHYGEFAVLNDVNNIYI